MMMCKVLSFQSSLSCASLVQRNAVWCSFIPLLKWNRYICDAVKVGWLSLPGREVT